MPRHPATITLLRQPNTPDENYGRILKIVREVRDVMGLTGASEGDLEEWVKYLCWERLGPRGYNSDVVSRAIEAIGRPARPVVLEGASR